MAEDLEKNEEKKWKKPRRSRKEEEEMMMMIWPERMKKGQSKWRGKNGLEDINYANLQFVDKYPTHIFRSQTKLKNCFVKCLEK
jgi:hypothetical protein